MKETLLRPTWELSYFAVTTPYSLERSQGCLLKEVLKGSPWAKLGWRLNSQPQGRPWADLPD